MSDVSKPVSANRRQFLWDIGARFPMLALVDLLSRDGFFTRHAHAAAPKSRRIHWRQAAALSGEGEARRLPVHERRAQPGRHVRPQAGAHAASRQALQGRRGRLEQAARSAT